MDVPPPAKPKFQWPPRPVDGSADATARARARSIAQLEAARPSTRELGAIPPLSWWAQVERTFFGVVRAPWKERTQEASWAPDRAEDYCARCGHTIGMFAEAPPAHAQQAQGSCAACARSDVPWERVVRMGAYQGVLREAVLEVKFSAWRRLASDVGGQFAPTLLEVLRGQGVEPESAVIVPIPSSAWRRMARGIDHSLTLARAVGGVAGVPVVNLLRRQHKPPQTGRTLDQRRRNVVRTMSVRSGFEPEQLAGRTVLLLDDVMTSGATMREACRALGHWQRNVKGSSPLRVWACPLAVTNAVEDDGQAGFLTA